MNMMPSRRPGHGARRKERVDARLCEARVEDERDRGRDDGAEGAAAAIVAQLNGRP